MNFLRGFRVLRGGSWADSAKGCLSAYLFRLGPILAYGFTGFRVVYRSPVKP
jgi:formylglycine-generating enzyme required for sulfatase activity